MDPLFAFHKLNEDGQDKAQRIAESFDKLLNDVNMQIGSSTLQTSQLPAQTNRAFAIFKTKLEEACFYAKKAMASIPENQEK